MASSSSSTSGVNKRRVKLIKPSRENHYEGEPIMCNHMVVAPRWTSWSDDNPGRRFYGCRYYNDQVCNFGSVVVKKACFVYSYSVVAEIMGDLLA